MTVTGTEIGSVSILKGNKANLPVLADGVMAVTEDERRLYIGAASGGNIALPRSVQEAWITPTLVNGWVANTQLPPAYYKDDTGIVRFKGRVASGTINTIIFTLPVGYRPIQAAFIPVLNNGVFGFLTINAIGTVILELGSNVYVQLDSVTFRAEQ